MKIPSPHPSAHRQSGQAAVETALMMPLFIFLILGILQLGLMAQARIVGKYAVYRAARIGAMHHANTQAMEAAAIFHLLPVLVNNSNSILPTDSTTNILRKYGRTLLENQLNRAGSIRPIQIVICGPTSHELRGTSSTDPLPNAGQTAMGGLGGNNEVDFDDPKLAVPGGTNPQTGRGMRLYNRLRLRVQLQWLYRMPIPFANWIMTRIYIGASLPSVLMMNRRNQPPIAKFGRQANAVRFLAARGIYTIPINVSYAMRMQSNFFLNRYRLPTKNDCIHYDPLTGQN
ncbi:MAG TPA: TadE/TadG family type IV pilus assembly protein [Myxococcaceae bacterium]|nr:TadE/TadG family type IV pilus assembly protein [Myxococcaceae bacterium]